jgi:methanogenic corrinoid protein MtbC1
VLARLLLESASSGAPGAPAKGPVLLGNVEDDFHPLGRKMVVAFLRADGWEVHDLGVDVPAEHFMDRAEETGARVIGASAMMYTTAKNVAKLREEIDRRGQAGRIQLAVGGAVFKLRPELVTTFGGDGTASSAVEAPALFERLWKRALAADSVPGEVRP